MSSLNETTQARGFNSHLGRESLLALPSQGMDLDASFMHGSNHGVCCSNRVDFIATLEKNFIQTKHCGICDKHYPPYLTAKNLYFMYPEFYFYFDTVKIYLAYCSDELVPSRIVGDTTNKKLLYNRGIHVFIVVVATTNVVLRLNTIKTAELFAYQLKSFRAPQSDNHCSRLLIDTPRNHELNRYN